MVSNQIIMLQSLSMNRGSSAKFPLNVVRKLLRAITSTNLFLRNFEKEVRESVFRETEFTYLVSED